MRVTFTSRQVNDLKEKFSFRMENKDECSKPLLRQIGATKLGVIMAERILKKFLLLFPVLARTFGDDGG